ncbi:MAG: ATP-binding protein [Gammaproteobacteria bacterium]|nr:ATP-binding protein [Gammaproteobacteria bacterium]MDH5303738.1 ATP-binding protein [Gammaproteobacteria bacterium]
MTSIRTYLIVALLSTVALGNFVAAVYGYRSSMIEAEALLDSQLNDAVSLIATMRTVSTPLVDAPSSLMAFQIWSADGKLIQRSANTSDAPITVFEDGYRDENFEGFRWRVLSRFDQQQQRWLLVGERIDIRTQLADKVILHAVMPIVASLPLVALVVWLVVGNGLSLVRKLAQELGGKRADDLSRLTTSNPPVELAPVVDAINDLLRRLQESVLRERRFSADAAHELRTPLSAIKVHIHNLRNEYPDETDALRTLDRDINRLSHLIEQIMLLYRTTPESYQANMQEVDLHALAQSVIGDLYADIDARQQSISLTGSAQTVTGDRDSLIILLSNLILNASKYSAEGASITVHVDRAELGICLSVADTGPGIPLAEISRVFDRFYRVGGDRHSSAADGCGLGLSIVKHIGDLHHANIVIENNADGPGLTVSVIFPADFQSPLIFTRHSAC